MKFTHKGFIIALRISLGIALRKEDYMFFKTDNVIDTHDVDHNGVARLSSLMRYIQSCAEAQLSSGGMSYDELRAVNRAFILSKIKLEFTEPLRVDDKICSITYPCESHGFGFWRCYAMEKNGVTIGRAISLWALIDTETRALVRVNDFELGLETHEPLALSLGRFKFPTDFLDVDEYRVRYADLDRNGHMNNTRYPDMYSDFLPMDGKRIHTIAINYQNEARPKEKLRIHIAKSSENLFYIRSIREDGLVNSEAEILLVDI